MKRYRDDLAWLVSPIAAGCIVYVVYLATNPYPAHVAGLYFTMAATVSEHGYALPRTIPSYTRDGIPFAYPPLGIYAIALVRDGLGIGPLAMSRWLPGLAVVVSSVPTYFLARELLDSRYAATVVTTMVAVNPQLLDWHLTAGGLIRAPAFLLTTVGLYAGLRRTRTGERRWIGLAATCFLLTLLLHPTTALFFAVSYLVLFLGVDRTPAGFVDCALVGFGGLVLAAPWWLTVVRVHGVDVFLGAMGTHGGVFGGVVARLAISPIGPVEVLLVFVIAASLAVGIGLGRLDLVGWLVVVSLVFSQPRFTLFVGTFLLVAVVKEVGTERRWWERSWIQRGGPALALGFAVVLSGLTGAGFVRDDTAAPRLSATPNHVDEADLKAMHWARSSTPTDASFVVLGDVAEWFPLFAERTLLVTPWGTEWEGGGAYGRHTAIYRTASRCDTERCLTAVLDRHDVRPDYVYVPLDRYFVQGTPHHRSAALVRSLERSDRYVLAFENEEVVIFRIVDDRRPQ